MPPQMMQYLTEAEIHDFNRSTPSKRLSEGKFYLKVFLLNDQLTNSAPEEGGPWKIASRAMKKIASTVVGRPLIVPPNTRNHFRGASGDPEEIIREQQRWAIGEFVREVVNAASSNAYGIVEVFREFVDEVKSGFVRGRPLPPYVSPLVEPYRMENGEVVDGRILHVQAVDASGFSPMVAKIVGTCTGMLEQCSAKLRNLGAASQLKAYQQTISELSTRAEIAMIKKEIERERQRKEIANLKIEIAKQKERRMAAERKIAKAPMLIGAAGNAAEDEGLGEVIAEYNQGIAAARKIGHERALEESLEGGLEELETEIDKAFGASDYRYRGQDLDFDRIFNSAGSPEVDDAQPSRITRGGRSIDLFGSSGEGIDYHAVFESARRLSY